MNIDKLYNRLPVPIRRGLLAGLMRVIAPNMRSFYSQFIRPNDVVFDIGANIGDYAAVFADLGAQVICVDPQPFAINKLHERFDQNPRVSIVAAGVAARAGKKTFFVSKANHSTSTFSTHFMKASRYHHRVWDRKIQVPVTTLDRLIRTYGIPRYCKVDVEGFEVEVFRGLTKKIEYLSFEHHSELHDTTTNVLSILERLGKAEYNFIPQLSFSFAYATWLTAEQMKARVRHSSWRENHGDVMVRFLQN